MKQRLMDLYFTEGADLSNAAVLVQAATDVGLDPEDVRAALASEQDVELVGQDVQQAKESGIEGVPCFIFDGKFAVSGAQSADYLAAAIQRVAQAHRDAAQ
jgi:predicted DsbA family dithiol-disulfide isomerase